MRIDTHSIRMFTLPIAIVLTVLMWKGYVPWYAVAPFSYGSLLMYVTPRTVLEFERKTRGV